MNRADEVREDRADPDRQPGNAGARPAPARIETSTVLRVLFTVLLVAALLWTLYQLEGVLLLLVMAIFFAYLIAPLVDLVERPVAIAGRLRHLGRAPAIAAVYVIVFGGLGVVAKVLLPMLGSQMTQFTAQAPTYISYMRSQLQAWNWFINPEQLPPSIRDPLQAAVGRTMETAGQWVTAGATGLLGMLAFLPWLVLIPILAFFLLKDASTFQAAALRLMPEGTARTRGRMLLIDLDRALAAYIRAQLLACVLVGAICTVGFLLIGLPYALVLGLLAGLLEFIPLVGPLVVAIGATVVGSFHSWSQGLVVLVFLGVLRVAQDYVFYPRLIGRGIHMHPLAVILAILSGAEIAGVAGIFLAIPTVAVLLVIVRHWFAYRRGLIDV